MPFAFLFLTLKPLLFKIQQHMVFDKVLLLARIHYRQFFHLAIMRPSIGIISFEAVITALAQDTANRHMHQVLLLFLGDLFRHEAGFLQSYQEQYRFQVGLFAKPVHQPRLERPPALL
ncbi:MAG: hypothetical protein JWQ78_1611 [Sediminibacterium sp.]|nr:hypothetical protein [Sediminibacterium sp.]